MAISISAPFELKSPATLDSRSVAESLDAFNSAYPAGSYTAGQVTYFTDSSALEVYDGSSWEPIALKSDIPTCMSDLEDDIGYLTAHQQFRNVTVSRKAATSLNLSVATDEQTLETTLTADDFIFQDTYYWDQSSTITSHCEVYLDSLNVLRDNSAHVRGYCRIVYSDASKTDDDLPIDLQTLMRFLCCYQISDPTLCQGRFVITDWSSQTGSTSMTLFGLTVTQWLYQYTPYVDLIAHYSSSASSFMVVRYMNGSSVSSASAGTLTDIYTTKKTISTYGALATTSASTTEEETVSVGFWYDFIIS